jgi:hypothetical protein
MDAAPPPLHSSTSARLRLAAQPAHGRQPRAIDGAWWPRSYDLAAELPALLAELPPDCGEITSVTVSSAIWPAGPARILVADRPVRLCRTTHASQDPPTICLLAPGCGRLDLLVAPPDASETDARRLMDSVT